MSQSSSSFMSQANTSSKLHIRKYIFDFLGNLGLLHRSSAQATPEPSKNKNTRVHVEIQKQDISKYRREIEHWQLARNLRYRTQEPLSHALQEVFTDAMLDTHLSAVTTNRILRLQNKRYVLRNANNELQKTRSQWLQRSWFQELIEHVMNSIFYGYSLVWIKSADPKATSTRARAHRSATRCT